MPLVQPPLVARRPPEPVREPSEVSEGGARPLVRSVLEVWRGEQHLRG